MMTRHTILFLMALSAACASPPPVTPQPPPVFEEPPVVEPPVVVTPPMMIPSTLTELMASYGSDGVLVMSGPTLGLVTQLDSPAVGGWVACWDVQTGSPAQCTNPIMLCEFDECFTVAFDLAVTDLFRRRR